MGDVSILFDTISCKAMGLWIGPPSKITVYSLCGEIMFLALGDSALCQIKVGKYL